MVIQEITRRDLLLIFSWKVGRMKLSREEIAELVSYDKETGVFVSLNTYRSSKRGEPIGALDPEGYAVLTLKRRHYRAHRVAWLLTHGEWPHGVIDHINGDRSDNRIINLRVTTVAGNAHNQRKAHADSLHGLLGVDLNKTKGRYRARIQVNGKRKTLGGFPTPQEAYEAYISAKRQLHETCTI